MALRQDSVVPGRREQVTARAEMAAYRPERLQEALGVVRCWGQLHLAQIPGRTVTVPVNGGSSRRRALLT